MPLACEQYETLGVRRVGPAMEVRAGVTAAGRTPYLVDDDDLLLLVQTRVAALRCRSHLDLVPPALLCVTEPGEVITLDFPTASPFRALYLRPGLLADELAPHAVSGKHVPTAEQRALWLITGPRVCEPADVVGSERGLGWLLDRVVPTLGSRLRRVADEPVAHPVVQRVRDHLRAEYARKVTLDELAQMAGMCRFGLVRAFTREVGMPPHAYQTHLRIARARAMIAAGWPLSDVSLEVGFTDQSHLNRHFKRLVGVTPGLYARANFSNVDLEVLDSCAPPRPHSPNPFRTPLRRVRTHSSTRLLT